jgi:hypothetical protein
MKNALPATRLTTLVIAALCGALIFMAVCFVMGFFPDFSIPIPTGIPFGRLNVGSMLGNISLYYAAICGALMGLVFILITANEREGKSA